MTKTNTGSLHDG